MYANEYEDDVSLIEDIRSTGLDVLVAMMSRGFIVTE